METYETAWHLVTHFFQDITHYDGKFISSIRYLVTRPGFLTREYMAGRRASYLNPVRMYVFTSAFFFIVFFSLTGSDTVKSTTSINGKLMAEIDAMDSTEFDTFTRLLNNDTPMTRSQFAHYRDSVSKKSGIHFTTSKYKSRAEYDSLRQAGKVKHGWFARTMIYKEIELGEKYDNDQVKILQSFKNKFIHTFPQILFISLPIFALILTLLYKRNKEHYYVGHAIFGIHFYVFIFLMLLLIIGINKLVDATGWHWIDYLLYFLTLYIFYYECKAMKVHYRQGWGKTFLKFILLNLGHLFVLVFLIMFFIFFSLLNL